MSITPLREPVKFKGIGKSEKGFVMVWRFFMKVLRKKEEGSITYSVFTLFFMSMVVLYMFANMYMREAQSIRKHYDNALTLSVLSVNICDKTSMFTYEEHLLQTENEFISYDINSFDIQSDFTITESFTYACKSAYRCAKKNFTNALKSYMKLNDSLESNLPMVKEIQIQQFVIYNVLGENVYEVMESSGGDLLVNCYENGKGSFVTPNGATVAASGVYANIKVTLNGIGAGVYNEMSLHSYIDVYSH